MLTVLEGVWTTTDVTRPTIEAVDATSSYGLLFTGLDDTPTADCVCSGMLNAPVPVTPLLAEPVAACDCNGMLNADVAW